MSAFKYIKNYPINFNKIKKEKIELKTIKCINSYLIHFQQEHNHKFKHQHNNIRVQTQNQTQKTQTQI